MTTDDKLDALTAKMDALHGIVIEMRAEQKTRNSLCEAAHKVVDSRLDGIHRKIEGNGKPGLLGDMSTLKDAFNDLKGVVNNLKTEVNTRTGIYAGIGVFVGGTLVTLAAAWIGRH